MNTYADKTQENKSQSGANAISQKQNNGKSTSQFVDNRPETLQIRELQEMASSRPEAVAQRKLQEMAKNSPQAQQASQLQAMAYNHSIQQQQAIQKKENNTGLPDNLIVTMENLSGISLDDIKVHHNSDKPAQLQAHAYAQRTDIHLEPGQEKHLPHEAWHVVQQKQGRVKPTMQMKGKVNVNDDAGLEKEADVMGTKAVQMKKAKQGAHSVSPNKSSVVQRTKDAEDVLGIEGFDYDSIISWNGEEVNHLGVSFVVDNTQRYMSVTLNPPVVRFNTVDVGRMTAPGRYFLIMHELSHVAYGHPGNVDEHGRIHPESVLNETQADDTALVNAMTHYPEKAVAAVHDFSNLLQRMVGSGDFGGGSHPFNAVRKSRLDQLLAAILDESKLNVHVTSFGTFPHLMKQFLGENAAALEIDSKDDIKTFQSSLYGTIYYLDYQADISLRHFLTWLPKYEQRKNLLLKFEYTRNWVKSPSSVQGNVKDKIAGAIP
jgi:hypothetical protein